MQGTAPRTIAELWASKFFWWTEFAGIMWSLSGTDWSKKMRIACDSRCGQPGYLFLRCVFTSCLMFLWDYLNLCQCWKFWDRSWHLWWSSTEMSCLYKWSNRKCRKHNGTKTHDEIIIMKLHVFIPCSKWEIFCDLCGLAMFAVLDKIWMWFTGSLKVILTHVHWGWSICWHRNLVVHLRSLTFRNLDFSSWRCWENLW